MAALEMQISKLSLELSTVKHEEAERVYNAQKLTGTVDLSTANGNAVADSVSDLFADDSRGLARLGTRSKSQSLIQASNRHRKSLNMQTKPAQMLQSHTRFNSGPLDNPPPVRHVSAGGVRDDRGDGEGSPKPSALPGPSDQNARRDKGKYGAAQESGTNHDDNYQATFSGSNVKHTMGHPATELTASVESSNIKSASPSQAQGIDGETSSPQADEDVLTTAPEPILAHEGKQSIPNSVGHTETSEPLQDRPEVSLFATSASPQSIPSDQGARQIEEASTNTGSAEGATSPPASPRSPPSVHVDRHATNDPLVVDLQADSGIPETKFHQSSLLSTSTMDPQSTLRKRASWRPKFLKSKEPNSSAGGRDVQPSSDVTRLVIRFLFGLLDLHGSNLQGERYIETFFRTCWPLFERSLSTVISTSILAHIVS
jgi:hypothetical protein